MYAREDRSIPVLTATQKYIYDTEGFLIVEDVLTPDQIAHVGAVDPTTSPVDLSRAVPVQLRAGGVSVHHGRTRHGSTANTSANPRRLLLWDLAAVDAWPLFRTVDDLDAFDRDIVRGEPTLRPRLAPVPVRLPLPLPAGTIFELQAAAQNKAFAHQS
jgi:hypothetical protein